MFIFHSNKTHNHETVPDPETFQKVLSTLKLQYPVLSACLPDLSASMLVASPSCVRVWWARLTLHASFGSSPIRLSKGEKLKHSSTTHAHTHSWSWNFSISHLLFFSVCILVLLRMVWLISHGATGTWLLTDRDATVTPEAPHLADSLNQFWLLKCATATQVHMATQNLPLTPTRAQKSQWRRNTWGVIL